VNIREPEGRARWEAVGKPTIPSLEVDGVASGIMHVSQVASMLGLAGGSAFEGPRLAWDIFAIMEAWVEHLRLLDWETICAPTPSRERSLRNLTCNAFHPSELLPEALTSGDFPWQPDDDHLREAALHSADEIVAYAERIAFDWQGWLLGADEVLERAAAQQVRNPERGALDGATLLAAQRWHMAFHYRQLKVFLASRGTVLPGSFRIEALADLDLPDEVF
jgi:hypothetical protein